MRKWFNLKKDVLKETSYAQPAILVTSIATLRALEQLKGLDVSRLCCVAGHSLGEYSALVATNSISLQNALQLVSQRGSLMHSATASLDCSWTMVALYVLSSSSLSEISKAVDDFAKRSSSLEVAQISNYNSAHQVSLSLLTVDCRVWNKGCRGTACL